ncbi:MAG: hypothetical protein AAGI11_05560 [Pseudomonadota bacterium]
MNILETEWWALTLPPEWWAEAEDESILIGDRDDVGCIEISSLHREQGAFAGDEIEAIIREASPSHVELRKANLGELRGVTCSYAEEDAAIRAWCVASDGLALFITYSCETPNRGLDDAAVDELLDTLIVLQGAAGS